MKSGLRLFDVAMRRHVKRYVRLILKLLKLMDLRSFALCLRGTMLILMKLVVVLIHGCAPHVGMLYLQNTDVASACVGEMEKFIKL